jgi:hypothetical protein
MKIALSITILSISVCYGQINPKTIELRKRYAHESTLQLKTPQLFPVNGTSIHNKNQEHIFTKLSLEIDDKPSTHSIQKAFNYYNTQRKQPDLSGFIMMGYSAFTKQPYSINSQPAESLRFFPANVKD